MKILNYMRAYYFTREDTKNNALTLVSIVTMTKTITTHICTINETFITIFIGIPLGYIVSYHPSHIMKYKLFK